MSKKTTSLQKDLRLIGAITAVVIVAGVALYIADMQQDIIAEWSSALYRWLI